MGNQSDPSIIHLSNCAANSFAGNILLLTPYSRIFYGAHRDPLALTRTKRGTYSIDIGEKKLSWIEQAGPS